MDRSGPGSRRLSAKLPKRYRVLLMKNVMLAIILMSTLIISACSGESVKHLQFTDEELNQIKVTTDGDYKIFTVPKRNWEIKAWLPHFRISRGKSKIFQATRHYDGEEMITVIATIIDPQVGCTDLISCFEYRKRLIKNIDYCTIFSENDRIIISQLGKYAKTTTILKYYDNVCVDILIITSQINQRGLDNTQRIVESLQILPR